MYVVDPFFDDLTEDTALEEITEQPGQERVIVVYARVSANENWPNLDSQAERLCTYCTAKGWKVVKFERQNRTEDRKE
jgi:predicted site-specific integrase-resolvase